ncbi:hypothetical protein D3C78_1181770 [compost metagenome]
MVTILPKLPSINAALAAIKVALIQTTPNTDIVACAPALNNEALATSAELVLVKMIIRAVTDSIMICIIAAIRILPFAPTTKFGANPFASAKFGIIAGNAPTRMIIRTPNPNSNTDSFAPGFNGVAEVELLSSRCFTNSGSFNFSKNSGSLSKSLPIFNTERMPAKTPIREAGIQIFNTSVIWKPLSRTIATIVAVAAETGLEVSPKWEAITEMLSGRSGLILFLAATSAIMGRIE